MNLLLHGSKAAKAAVVIQSHIYGSKQCLSTRKSLELFTI